MLGQLYSDYNGLQRHCSSLPPAGITVDSSKTRVQLEQVYSAEKITIRSRKLTKPRHVTAFPAVISDELLHYMERRHVQPIKGYQ